MEDVGDSPREGVLIQNRSRWEALGGVLVTGIELDKDVSHTRNEPIKMLNDLLYDESK